MTGYHHASSALTLLVLLMAAWFPRLSSPNPITPSGYEENSQQDALVASADRQGRSDGGHSVKKDDTEEQEELFKDVDPKRLAAVLLEAMNRSLVDRAERWNDREERDGVKEATKTEVGKDEETLGDTRTMEGAGRDRDGRQELELLMAAQGKEQEKKEEEERKKAQEEEERMTEKVTSRTTSQTVQVKVEPVSPEGRGGDTQDVTPNQVAKGAEQGANEEEEEEQLSPEELKSLETMMKEFPRLNTATKREGESEQNQRESRGYSSHNEILPINKGSNLSMSKKKLKWQEETQKAMNFPTFREGNFMDDFEDSPYNGVQAQSLAEEEPIEDNETEDESEDEEVLSPEEEEARAKAEQEEMRRQAAEAQRAKMEEEKLADIASDMLLRYMVKQNGNRKYGNRKYGSSSAAEDKRSDEEQEATEQDDIDPQTIDKLIEISSKLHLPADDVVDIISDVEKKKKKDVPPEMASPWQQQQPLNSLPSSFSSTKGFSTSQIYSDQNNFPVSKQPSPAVNLLKTWFQEKSLGNKQDLWSKPTKPLRLNPNLSPKSQRPIKQELWLKSPKPVWNGYPFYPYAYPPYYQRKPYPDYYPIYFPSSSRPKPQYYVHKPALSRYVGNTEENAYAYPPKLRYRSWVQPRLRQPPMGAQQKPYYPFSMYPGTFQALPVPKPNFPPVIPPPRKQFYFPAPVPAVTRNEDFYATRQQQDGGERDNLEKYIQQILMKRPQRFD